MAVKFVWSLCWEIVLAPYNRYPYAWCSISSLGNCTGLICSDSLFCCYEEDDHGVSNNEMKILNGIHFKIKIADPCNDSRHPTLKRRQSDATCISAGYMLTEFIKIDACYNINFLINALLS